MIGVVSRGTRSAGAVLASFASVLALALALAGCGTSRAPLESKALNGLLLPRGSMPNGYTADNSATVYDGSMLPSDTPSAVPAAQVCDVLTQTAWIRASGISAADFAEAGYASPDRTASISEEIDAFKGDDAQQAMTELWDTFGRCAVFTEPFGGKAVKTTLTRSVLGGQWGGIEAVELSPSLEGGLTVVAVHVGYAIVTVLDSSTGSDDGSAAVSMADRIATRLSAAENGS